MKRLAYLALMLIVMSPVLFAGQNFNAGWKFSRGAHPGAEAVSFDDMSWTPVRLPHDWAISGPYEPEGNGHTGKLPWQGEGWYRKTFSLAATDSGKQVYLDFDGVMAMPVVYVNGQEAGRWDYGYMSFRVDATKFVHFGASNVVAVHADTRQHQSRWYPGAGIYRKVELVVSDPVSIAHWGTFVTTPEISSASATVKVQTAVENHRERAATVKLESTLVDPDGRELGKQPASSTLAEKGAHEFDQTFSVTRPELWDVKTPRLYKVISRVLVDGRLVDQNETPFGIRSFEFTADEGFHLNGRRLQLHGVCLHHDQGPLGAVFLTRAMERQLEIMKDMGVNAVRTSHNPPAPELLDLCDRMGMVVWDEVFDKWDGTSTRSNDVPILDYNRKQIENFVRRDRNHPSIVVWSTGNEIFDLENGKVPNGVELLRQQVQFFKELDPTRPVTLAHAVPQSARTPLDDSLDVAGWNYQRRYAIEREVRPKLPIVYSESASAYSTRGYYQIPHPADKTDYSITAQLTSYDRNCATWADLADTEFALMERDRFVAGEFVWTGFDYLGEPVPFISEGWGSFKKRKLAKSEEGRSSSFGIVDLAGIPKDRFYLYRSYWAPEVTTVHILPHWNWPDRVGANVPVYVYTNGNSAELFINGKSQGRKSKNPQADDVLDRYRLRWEDAVYQPGEVRAVAYQGGREIGTAIMKTAGEPATIRLTPDRAALKASGDDLCYVLVEAIDKDGILCPLAMNDVQFEVTGPAKNAGVGNGDPHFPHEYVAKSVPLFYGKAMLILRTEEGRGGAIRVKATSAGLKPATVTVTSR